jgi:DNA-binding response OmpR family regulator
VARRRRILVLDDDLETLRLVTTTLEAAGYEALSAETVHAGLVAWQQGGRTLDLLVADLNLPDGSGLDLARKALEESKSIMVVLMTGLVDTSFFLSPGFRQRILLLRKPFTREELLDVVNACSSGICD